MAELTVNEAALTPLKVTAVAPLKAVPLMVTEVPAGPLVGLKPLIVGGGMIVKSAVLVAVPPRVVTAILPVVAPVGTMAVISVADTMLTATAGVPLNVTEVVLIRFVPEIVTSVPMGPELGLNMVMSGPSLMTSI